MPSDPGWRWGWADPAVRCNLEIPPCAVGDPAQDGAARGLHAANCTVRHRGGAVSSFRSLSIVHILNMRFVSFLSFFVCFFSSFQRSFLFFRRFFSLFSFESVIQLFFRYLFFLLRYSAFLLRHRHLPLFSRFRSPSGCSLALLGHFFSLLTHHNSKFRQPIKAAQLKRIVERPSGSSNPRLQPGNAKLTRTLMPTGGTRRSSGTRSTPETRSTALLDALEHWDAFDCLLACWTRHLLDGSARLLGRVLPLGCAFYRFDTLSLLIGRALPLGRVPPLGRAQPLRRIFALGYALDYLNAF